MVFNIQDLNLDFSIDFDGVKFMENMQRLTNKVSSVSDLKASLDKVSSKVGFLEADIGQAFSKVDQNLQKVGDHVQNLGLKVKDMADSHMSFSKLFIDNAPSNIVNEQPLGSPGNSNSSAVQQPAPVPSPEPIIQSAMDNSTTPDQGLMGQNTASSADSSVGTVSV